MFSYPLVLGSPEFKYFSQLFWLETEDMVLYTDIFQGCKCFSMVQKLQWAEFAHGKRLRFGLLNCLQYNGDVSLL